MVVVDCEDGRVTRHADGLVVASQVVASQVDHGKQEEVEVLVQVHAGILGQGEMEDQDLFLCFVQLWQDACLEGHVHCGEVAVGAVCQDGEGPQEVLVAQDTQVVEVHQVGHEVRAPDDLDADGLVRLGDRVVHVHPGDHKAWWEDDVTGDGWVGDDVAGTVLGEVVPWQQ